jgi:hypothetical protein
LKNCRTTKGGIGGLIWLSTIRKDSIEILETWIRLKKERRDLSGSIKCVAFADDKFFYPLQAAGLLANLATRDWREGAPQELPDDHHLKRIFPRDKQGSAYLDYDFITAGINEAVRKHTKLFFWHADYAILFGGCCFPRLRKGSMAFSPASFFATANSAFASASKRWKRERESERSAFAMSPP